MDLVAPSGQIGTGPAGRRRADLLVYGSSRLLPDEAHALVAGADGLVLPGTGGRRLARRLVRERGYSGRLWLDAIRYLRRSEDGPVPRQRQESLIDEWLLHQQESGVTEILTAPEQVLSDGDVVGLMRLLDDEQWPASSRVVLPLESAWLSNHSEELCAAIRLAARPVAVALRASFDPVGSFPRVRGLVALADSSLDVMLLRADPSAVGALAFGMRSAAVGVNTYTRHIPGPRPRTSVERPLPPTGTDVYIPALGAHHWAATLQMMEAVGAAELRGLDVCRCRCCRGQSLTRFAYSVDRAAGRAHDVASVLQLGSELRQQDPADRPTWWMAHCARSLAAHRWLREAKHVAVRVPGAVDAWIRFGELAGSAR